MSKNFRFSDYELSEQVSELLLEMFDMVLIEYPRNGNFNVVESSISILRQFLVNQQYTTAIMNPEPGALILLFLDPDQSDLSIDETNERAVLALRVMAESCIDIND